jgi:hypothetical protein
VACRSLAALLKASAEANEEFQASLLGSAVEIYIPPTAMAIHTLYPVYPISYESTKMKYEEAVNAQI